MYTYNAIIKRIIDGDTIDIRIDLGFSIFVDQTIRLNGIDAYETRLGPNTTLEQKNIGLEGKEYLKEILPEGTPFIVKTKKDSSDKYGRYLGDIILGDSTNISDLMVAKGFAVYKIY